MFLALLRPRRIVTMAVAFVALLVALDFGARFAAEGELANRAKAATHAQGSSASIGGFPFLWKLLAEGNVSSLDVQLSGVPVGTLELQSVDVHLTGTSINRTALFSHRQVQVASIEEASATVTVTAAELSSAIGQTVVIPGDGQIDVEVAGRQVPATVEVSGGHSLVVIVGGVTLLSSDLTQSPLVPQCG
ncbi:MAG TPA: DUF2993 domain-containing protein, partial [Acidimicrobiales bacterium]|nr:DUF2993 domain-containing protein [Acidimicrobiales bacterium]